MKKFYVVTDSADMKVTFSSINYPSPVASYVKQLAETHILSNSSLSEKDKKKE